MRAQRPGKESDKAKARGRPAPEVRVRCRDEDEPCDDQVRRVAPGEEGRHENLREKARWLSSRGRRCESLVGRILLPEEALALRCAWTLASDRVCVRT